MTCIGGHPIVVSGPGTRISPGVGTGTTALPTRNDGSNPKWVLISVEDNNSAFLFVAGVGEGVTAATGIQMNQGGINPMVFGTMGMSFIATIQNGGAGALRIHALENQ